ncbi:hypothetical protein KFE98_05095 [bacterium SCSIO 12741]|nr:hypothetical protein KFE98_05095 [bacterium SCSIO 12741]
MKSFGIGIAFILLLLNSASAQVQFLLLSGQEFEGKILSQTEEYLEIEYERKGKTKVKMMDKTRFFSYTVDGKETIVYDPEESELGFSVEDMRYYIYGQQDALVKHKTTLPVITSAVVSFGTAFYAGYEGSGLVVLSPVVGTIAGSLTQRNGPTLKSDINPEYLNKPAYIMGYKKQAKARKVLNCIGIGIASATAGALAGLITGNNTP